MELVRAIKRLVFGLSVPQQYVCVSYEAFADKFVTVTTGSPARRSSQLDLTLVGYKPVIFAASLSSNPALPLEKLQLNFSMNSDSKCAQKKVYNHPVAKLELNALPCNFQKAPEVSVYQAIHGTHRFLNSFHQASNTFKERFIRRKPGNISLPGNLHDMVRIAYAIPRKIALVTVCNADKMNLFPTDLHGRISEKLYISSLRIGGKAEEQVRQQRQIVISEIDSTAYDDAYRLGKNHMRGFAAWADFALYRLRSEKFDFPLPRAVVRYYELEVIDHEDVGIHRLFVYRIVNVSSVSEEGVLAHIHQYCAQWRVNQNIKTNFLLRSQ